MLRMHQPALYGLFVVVRSLLNSGGLANMFVEFVTVLACLVTVAFPVATIAGSLKETKRGRIG
jgi:hypothetical protein